MSIFPRKMRPESTFSRPAINLRRVVFPQPDGPSRAKNSPEGISKEILSKMVWPFFVLDTFFRQMFLTSSSIPLVSRDIIFAEWGVFSQ